MQATMQAILNDKTVINAIIFCLAAFLGQVLHAVKKWADGEVSNPLDWITISARHTTSAILGNLGGMIAFISTGVLEPMTPGALLIFGLMNGFTADSALNKATRQAWTPEQRATAAEANDAAK